jgi:hypothetical protein
MSMTWRFIGKSLITADLTAVLGRDEQNVAAPAGGGAIHEILAAVACGRRTGRAPGGGLGARISALPDRDGEGIRVADQQWRPGPRASRPPSLSLDARIRREPILSSVAVK